MWRKWRDVTGFPIFTLWEVWEMRNGDMFALGVSVVATKGDLKRMQCFLKSTMRLILFLSSATRITERKSRTAYKLCSSNSLFACTIDVHHALNILVIQRRKNLRFHTWNQPPFSTLVSITACGKLEFHFWLSVLLRVSVLCGLPYNSVFTIHT
jgi:hypothetical protein